MSRIGRELSGPVDTESTATAHVARRLGGPVQLVGLARRYGSAWAVREVDLEIAPGEFVTLLGPSGSGKTTTLMMVAGLVEPTSGDILIDGRSVMALPPARRNIGVVFQHYALFPHLSVAENIAFPLRMRGCGAREIRQRVEGALELVRLSGFGTRFPAQLSGGEQQRVALARAVVFSPQLLLLDEPLGALDKKLRDRMQAELKSLHRTLGVTIIHVTHDQTEALAMSDRVAVLNRGQIQQVGSPRELYEVPRTEFVADFLGDSNFLPAVVRSVEGEQCGVETAGGLVCRVETDTAWKVGQAVRLMIRPERLSFLSAPNASNNCYRGRIEDVTYVGDAVRYRVRLSPNDLVTAVVANGPDGMVGLGVGASVIVGWRNRDMHLFAAQSADNA